MPLIMDIDRERRFVVHIVERVAAHYDVEEAGFGKVYRWCPANVVAECYCGDKINLTLSKTTCHVCGSDLSEAAREGLSAQKARDEELHPWRYAREPQGAGLPY